MKYSVRNGPKRYHNSHEGNPYMQMIEKKLNDELNNYCVECGNENPEYISINNGVFICGECVQNHFRFPKNISRIINNNIKALTLDEIQFLLCGGNRALLDFINNEFPKLSEFPPNILYRTQAMVYYRQNLQYLINGGIAPIKPSLKYAYKVSNFINNLQSEFNNMKENINNNYNMSENETYNTIQEERRILSSINNFNEFENCAKFNQSNYNFRKGNNINEPNFNDRIININTNCSRGKEYDNYIINKPRQINFQNNNNIIIGNLNTHNELTEIKEAEILNPQKNIKFDFKPKNKRKIHKQIKEPTNYLNNVNEVYIKPKLVLSPKINVNCLTINGTLSHRNGSVELDKKSYNNKDNNNIDINEINNIINNNKYLIKKKLNKNSSQDLYLFTQSQFYENKKNKGKYIHKSLSQRDIKDDEITINKNKNKSKRIFINTNEKYEIINKIKEQKNMNKNNGNNLIKGNYEINQLYTLNNEKFITEQNQHIIPNEVESLPIKINLKNNKNKNKEINREINKNKIINEKNYFSSDESKNIDDNNPINKKINKEKIIYNNKKEKEKDNISDKNDKSVKANLSKHLSQTNICKESKDRNKKILCDKINVKDINKVSIRNKYKLKRKNNF